MIAGAYKTHLFVLKLELGPHDTPPSEYATHVHVEYQLANSLVSRAQVRSISLSGQYYEQPPDSTAPRVPATASTRRYFRRPAATAHHYEEPPDRWVRHVSRYEYSVEVEFTEQLRAPTQTEAPHLDDIFSLQQQQQVRGGGYHDDDAERPGSATASGSESTADESSDSSDSD